MRGPQHQTGRNTRPGKVDRDTGRRYGETGAGKQAQLKADREWWNIGPLRRSRVKAIVRGIDPDGQWKEDERGSVAAPVTAPLGDTEIAEQLPTLPFTIHDQLPRVRGKMREYVTLVNHLPLGTNCEFPTTEYVRRPR